jgi:hypothetical protein
MVVVPAKKILSIGKIVTIFFAVLIVALGVALTFWIGSHTKAEKTAETHAHQASLIQEEALLGKSKKEVYDLIGYPNSYQKGRFTESFPNNMDAWDKKIHVWAYSSSNGEIRISFDLYFSDDERVDFVDISWENLETSKLWGEKQGTENKYYHKE